jgi:hypothetical protein
MPNFFAMRREQHLSDLREISICSVIGGAATAAFIRYALDPTQLVDYFPIVFGGILGASVAAGIQEHDEQVAIARNRDNL